MGSMVDHIALLVDSLEKAENWYMDNLDATVEFKDQFYTRLRLGNVCIALIDKTRYPCEHIGILVEDVKNLPLEKGEIVKHRDGTIAVYVTDPFRNYLDVYLVYRPTKKRFF